MSAKGGGNATGSRLGAERAVVLSGRILITGGAGFIGSHLAQRLKAEGHSLILVDDLSTGRRCNVETLLDDRCGLIEAKAADALRKHPNLLDGVTQVYHLAAAVGVKLITDDPGAMIHNNVEQTRAVLDAARRVGVPVLLTSSSEVYGKCPVLPLHEQMDLVYGPTTASRWSYGLSKAIDEHLAIDYHRKYGLPTVIVRLFNTIGARQVGHYGMVVPRFIARAVANEMIEVYGDGKQTRTFCDVRDVTAAMVKLMANPSREQRVFNLGSTTQVTIEALADKVIELADSSSGKRFIPYEHVYGKGFEDPPHRLPDISQIESAIGFRQTIPLEQTLRDLIELHRRERCATGTDAVSAGSVAS